MIGAFGGCYSMRRTLYKEIPIDTLVMDDFYLSMWVLKQNKSAINELDAISFEDVSNKLSEEFRRKVRISLGNFHNLFLFIDLLKPKYKSVAFCYFSHKVLRWFTPILLLVNIIMSLILYKTHIIYQLALMFHFLLILILICDLLINKIGWNFKWVRFVTHFYSMNLALLLGLIKYLKGSKSIAWKPTERDQ
jgi:hypothetical protein